jgi:hypothetical protein
MSEQASRDDIESLAEKLDVFAASLSDQERDLLAQVLENGAQSAEVSGFATHGSYSTTTAGLMALNLGPQLSFERGGSLTVFRAGVGDMRPKE